jgi:ketosteroid isomerase-like protein
VSQENVELVRSALLPVGVDLVPLTRSGELLNLIDPTAAAPDLEVAFATPAGPMTEFRGLDGFIQGWSDWMIPWASYQVDIKDMLDAGDRVVALVTLSGQTLHDAVRIEQPGAGVFTVTGGRIVRVEFHLDQREALESAGLSG